ncbi:hypothetical protein [Pandoraea fibrosis]|uniref:Glycosyl transferase n=1 Tax=Pandoraea fibrosis TaxID=1891094 RepID=A0A5E4VQT0_9BURK|nr:hypothetical protein [Pandoraea fibrosis]VVE13634.1 glycosyl transferase [Pandoraea fibrosis]
MLCRALNGRALRASSLPSDVAFAEKAQTQARAKDQGATMASENGLQQAISALHRLMNG